MLKSFTAACLFAALAVHAQVPCKWDAEASEAAAAKFDCYRGETLVFQPTFLEYGVTASNATYTLLWQTNGMGTAWWSTNIMQFTPAMDVGATAYTVFIRADGTNGTSYRANAKLKMIGSPGATVNALPLPVQLIDFGAVATSNAPWLLAELDPGIPAAIDTAVAIAGTNAQAMADLALSKTTRIYNPANASEYIDGAGNKYVVSNFWNMTFSADFPGQNVATQPAQTNYIFTSHSYVYREGVSEYWTRWQIGLGGIYHFPGGFYNREWYSTTNSLVLDPDIATGAAGYAYITYWTTTNLVGTFALESSVLATKELHTDSYTNVIWKTVYSNGWMWLVAYTNYPAQ